jgi:uncharacterized surface protein with fasciclin (FAS1) repeats
MNKLLILLFTFFVAAFHLSTAAETSLRASNELELKSPEVAEDEHGEDTKPDLWTRALHSARWFYAAVQRPDIVDTAINSGLSSLVDFVVKAGLEETLRGDGPFTVFAPTNAAFAALPDGVKNTLSTNMEALQYVLLYHVVPGESIITYGNIWRGGGPFLTATDKNATVTTKRYRAGRSGPLVSKVNDAVVVVSNVITSNGVVHVIDSVLVPPSYVG